MKRRSLYLAAAMLLALGVWWLARSPRGASVSRKSGLAVESETLQAQPKADPMVQEPARLTPPNPMRRFTEFTPEQRVEFARKGHGPGG